MPDDPTETFTSNTVPSEPTGPYANPFAAYLASKKLAYLRTRDFLNAENPHFGIINIMPSFVIGRKDLTTTPEAVASGSNRHIVSTRIASFPFKVNKHY